MNKSQAYGLLLEAVNELVGAGILDEECMDPRDCEMGRSDEADAYRCPSCAVMFALGAIETARADGSK